MSARPSPGVVIAWRGHPQPPARAILEEAVERVAVGLAGAELERVRRRPGARRGGEISIALAGLGRETIRALCGCRVSISITSPVSVSSSGEQSERGLEVAASSWRSRRWSRTSSWRLLVRRS